MLRVDRKKIEILQARNGLSVGKLITTSGLTEKNNSKYEERKAMPNTKRIQVG